MEGDGSYQPPPPESGSESSANVPDTASVVLAFLLAVSEILPLLFKGRYSGFVQSAFAVAANVGLIKKSKLYRTEAMVDKDLNGDGFIGNPGDAVRVPPEEREEL